MSDGNNIPLTKNVSMIIPIATILVFGNEKSGLTSAELSLCDLLLRAPLAADQPSLNLAQAVQLVAYELFVTALEEREAQRRTSGLSHPHATRNPG